MPKIIITAGLIWVISLMITLVCYLVGVIFQTLTDQLHKQLLADEIDRHDKLKKQYDEVQLLDQLEPEEQSKYWQAYSLLYDAQKIANKYRIVDKKYEYEQKRMNLKKRLNEELNSKNDAKKELIENQAREVLDDVWTN